MDALELLAADDPRLEASADLSVAIAALTDPSADLDDEARLHRDEILRFVVEHDDAALRTSVVGHLTGSAVVVNATGHRTLLMLHRKLGRWFQPGGHADGDTNLVGVALREATEETGIAGLRVLPTVIDVDVHRVEIPGEAPHLHLDARFLVVAPRGAVEQANEESLALLWVDEAALDQLDPPVDHSTRRLVRCGLLLAHSVLSPTT